MFVGVDRARVFNEQFGWEHEKGADLMNQLSCINFRPRFISTANRENDPVRRRECQ